MDTGPPSGLAGFAGPAVGEVGETEGGLPSGIGFGDKFMSDPLPPHPTTSISGKANNELRSMRPVDVNLTILV